MLPTLIDFGGQTFDLHCSGALYWRAQNMLVLSDLHVEKGSRIALKRYFVPPYDTAETLQRLETVIAHFAPERILLLGDVFQDARAYGRMGSADRAQFDRLLGQSKVIWIEGNHDIGAGGHNFVQSHVQDNIWFRHMATDGSDFEISGHYHPAATIRHKGQKVRAPCFVVNERQLLMPAFGAYTGGLDVTDKAMKPFVTPQTKLYLLGPSRVYEAPLEKLDRL